MSKKEINLPNKKTKKSENGRSLPFVISLTHNIYSPRLFKRKQKGD